MRMGLIFIAVLVLVFGSTLLVPQAQTVSGTTQRPEDFFKGKTIKLVVDASPGSSKDLTARIIRPYLESRLGATVVITNLAGSGGLEGQNNIWKANPNGLTLGITQLAAGVGPASILGMPGSHFNVEKFSWIGCPAVEEPIFWVSKTGRIKSIEDFKKAQNLKFTGTAKTEVMSLWAMSIPYWFGINAKVISGLALKDTELIVIRNEADGSIIGPARLSRGEKAGTHKGLFVMTATGKRISVFPDLPEIREVVTLDEEKMKYCKMATSLLSNNGKTICGPPEIPSDRLKFLRETFTWITKQEEFIREMEKFGGSVPEFKSGEELQNDASAIVRNKDYLVEKFRFLMERYGS